MSLVVGAAIGTVLGFVGGLSVGVIDTVLHVTPIRHLDLSYLVGMTAFYGGLSAWAGAVVGYAVGFLYWALSSFDR